MKKFIGKVEALNLYLAGEDGILVFDGASEEVIDFCDIAISDYRDNADFQYMIDTVAADKPYVGVFESFVPVEPALSSLSAGGSVKITTTAPIVNHIAPQRDYAEAQCP